MDEVYEYILLSNHIFHNEKETILPLDDILLFLYKDIQKKKEKDNHEEKGKESPMSPQFTLIHIYSQLLSHLYFINIP